MANVRAIYRPGQSVTARTTAAVTGGRFVDISGNRLGTLVTSGVAAGLDATASGGNIQVAHAAAGDIPFGVANYDAASGALVTVLRGSGLVVQVEAEGALTAGDLVEVGTAGVAQAVTTGSPVGKALTAAADGTLAEIALFY